MSFCGGIYSPLKFQGNINAIKYSLHSSGKCILVNESSTWIKCLSLRFKKNTKAKTNTSVNKTFVEEASWRKYMHGSLICTCMMYQCLNSSNTYTIQLFAIAM